MTVAVDQNGGRFLFGRERMKGFDLNLADYIAEQKEFSQRAFGPQEERNGLPGVVAHIRKELREIEEDPRDLMEWVDVAILAFDGAWRAGFTPEQIVVALAQKQIINKGRVWPDWRTVPGDEAIEHIRTEDELRARQGSGPVRIVAAEARLHPTGQGFRDLTARAPGDN